MVRVSIVVLSLHFLSSWVMRLFLVSSSIFSSARI